MAEETQERPIIPDAGGLVKELDKRAEGRWSVSKPEGKSFGNGNYLIETDVLIDGKKIGTLKAHYYIKKGVERIAFMGYEGTLPGYINSFTNKPSFGMVASEDPYNDIRIRRFKLSDKPNNTSSQPPYRQDGHYSLDLATFEIKNI